MTPILLATRNRGKIAELRRILQPRGLHVLDVDEAPGYPDVPETGATFADNAVLKARAAGEATGLVSVADDSGLCVDALGGMPGILSARWSGRHGDDAANLALLLGQLSDVEDTRRGAAFYCAAAVVFPGRAGVQGRPGAQVVTGVMRGRVIGEPRGSGGFGYDPVFVPHGQTRTTAELSPAEKDAISHRGKAFQALAELLAGSELTGS